MKDKQRCKNPNHKHHVVDFVKKYPSAKDRVPNKISHQSIQMIHLCGSKKSDFEYKQNVARSDIAEDIARARKGIRSNGSQDKHAPASGRFDIEVD